MMKNNITQVLSAIAHDGRLSLMQELLNRGERGEIAGGLAQALAINATTASVQLQTLAQAGLVTSRRVGRNVIYKANTETMRRLVCHLNALCCRPDACCKCCEKRTSRNGSDK